jgi:putative membrane protein
LGTPGWLIRPLLNHPWVITAGRSQIYPVVAFGAFHLFFSLVHLPAIYDQVFKIEVVHAGIHGVLLVTGLLTWLPIFSPVPDLIPRLSVPGQMLYCFLATFPATLVGAMITLSDGSLYTYYNTAGPLAFGISPIDDQAVGGLIMWVIGGTYYYALLTALFFMWARREEVHAYGA